MDERYIEQIVKKKDSPFNGLIKSGLILVGVLLFFLGVGTMRMGFAMIGILFFVALYFITPYLSVEYEYLYVSKEISVDKILNKENRKKMGNWELTNLELFVSIESDRLKEYENKKYTVLDFTSREADARVYVMIINDKKPVRIHFEPNDELIYMIKSNFPRQSRE